MNQSVEHHILFALLHLVRARLQRLERKYKSSKQVTFIIDYLKSILLEEATQNPLYSPEFLHISEIDPGAYELDKPKVVARLCARKAKMDPCDYLLMRAALSEDYPEACYYARMAQHIHPDDFLVFIFLNTNWEAESCKEELSRAIDLYPSRRLRKEEKDFIRVVNFACRFELVSDSYSYIQKLVGSIPGFPGLLYALIREHDDKVDPHELIRLLEKLRFPNIREHIRFEYLRCRLLFRAGQHKEARQRLFLFDFEEFLTDDTERLELLSLEAKLNHEYGEKRKAVLTWKNIVYNEDFRDLWHDAYFEAMIMLALHYALTGNTKESRKTLHAAGRFSLGCAMERHPALYYQIRGEQFMAEGNIKRAVWSFKKALSMANDHAVREKLQGLEKWFI